MKNTNVMQISNQIINCFLLFSLILISCSKKAIPPPVQTARDEEREYLPFPFENKPTEKTPIENLPKMTSINTISEIQLPFFIDSNTLIRQVNQLIPDTLYNDQNITDDHMIVIAKKLDDVDLTVLPNKLVYSVPFKLHLERDIGFSVAKADGSLKLHFNTEYKILENWFFESKTTIIGHEWIETPKVKVGILNIPIEPIANKIIERSAEMVSKNIDAQLMESFKLRDYVDLAWRRIQQPIQLTDTPIVSWLLIRPQKIMMEPLNTNDGNVHSTLVFRSITDLAFGPMPDLPYAGILPTFEQLNKGTKDSIISLSIRFPLERAEILLSDYFKGQEFRDGNKVMMIDSIHLSGNGKK
ncbi:MAG: DUF4403 family protein, partial [Saprospiraceae bacterium]